jgi:hypothetical protein
VLCALPDEERRAALVQLLFDEGSRIAHDEGARLGFISTTHSVENH